MVVEVPGTWYHGAMLPRPLARIPSTPKEDSLKQWADHKIPFQHEWVRYDQALGFDLHVAVHQYVEVDTPWALLNDLDSTKLLLNRL